MLQFQSCKGTYVIADKALTYLPQSLRIGGPTKLPILPNATMDEFGSTGCQSRSSSPSTTSGLEVVNSLMAKMSVGEVEVLTQRQRGMQRTKDIIYEQIANNQFPMEESEFIVLCLEKRADPSVRQTYYDGKRMSNISDKAVIPKIGMTFMAGADTPQVNRMEQVGMTSNTPNQKNAIWRVNTAGTLLNDFEVDTDLSIIQSDNTPQIVARARSRESFTDDSRIPNSTKRAPSIRRCDQRTVTIHSDHVEIVNDLAAGDWDLESTLIEVDGSSLTNLIVNYRHLIYRGGPALTFPETVKLLDIMIEDARRLCIRSPILFRMSTRRHIMSSKNTRYGVDHGLMFRTLTTSRGIKNIISFSASYFNALSTPGSRDKSQELIRPKFLQMLVLLLSLLNEEDLSELKEFLETTYNIKADRRSLELLILKVLPLMSINSKVFIKSLVIAVEGPEVEADLDMRRQGNIWNSFVQRLLQMGYMLPGSVAQLGQTNLSWVFKWSEDGIKDSYLFRNIQYGGVLRTMNGIPSLDLNPNSVLDEVTIVLTNGNRCVISYDDLENIICMTPGKYSLIETTARERYSDLQINEVVVNSALYEAIFRLNRIITEYNSYLVLPRRRSSVMAKLSSLREKPGSTPLKEIKGSGRLTRNLARLNDQILAVAYKVEGRKITRRDLLRHLACDIRTVSAVARALETAIQDHDQRDVSDNVRKMVNLRRGSLDKIREQIAQADDQRARLGNHHHGELSDEPIARVVYPNGSQEARMQVWHEYRSWYVSTENTLHIEAQRYLVKHVEWITDCIIDAELSGLTAKYLLSPLAAVLETERADEIHANDTILLVGQYVVVVEPGEGQGSQEKEAVTNWLKIVGIEQYTATKRGMNRISNSRNTLAQWSFH